MKHSGTVWEREGEDRRERGEPILESTFNAAHCTRGPEAAGSVCLSWESVCVWRKADGRLDVPLRGGHTKQLLVFEPH